MRQPARQRVPAERRAVVPRHDAFGHFLRDHRGPDGEPVAQRFRRGEDVRVCGSGEALVRPQLPRARESALDLVVDEHGADFVAAVPQGLEEGGRGHVDPAFALDGLDDHPAGFFGDEVPEAGFVVVGAVDEAGDHGAEGFLVFGVRRRGQAAHGPPVEGIVEADDLVLRPGRLPHLADLPGELDGGFVGLGAGVADEDLGRVGHGACGARLLDHELREGAGPGVVVQVGSVDQRPRLLPDQFRHLGVAVAQRVDGDARGEVEVFPVLDVPEVAAFASDHHGRGADVGRDHVLGVLADDGGGLRIARWVGVREGGFVLRFS